MIRRSDEELEMMRQGFPCVFVCRIKIKRLGMNGDKTVLVGDIFSVEYLVKCYNMLFLSLLIANERINNLYFKIG